MGKPKPKPKDLEHRTFESAGLELREAPGGVTAIEGYAAVFNQAAYGEKILPGAFTKSLRERPDIKAYWSHNSAMPIGRTSNGSLVLREDEKGLWVRIEPNQDITWARDALESVRSGLVSQFSFGMRVISAVVEEHEGEQVTVLKEVALYEVSPVAEPWYEGTCAVARERDCDEDDAAGRPEPVQADHSTEAQSQARTRRLRLLQLQEQ